MNLRQPRPSLIDAAPSARAGGSEIPAAGERYTAVAQALHWVTAALMFIALPLAWTGVNIPESLPRHEALLALHKSVGLTILAVVAIRLAWRASHPPPPLSAALARWVKLVSAVSHSPALHVLLADHLLGNPAEPQARWQATPSAAGQINTGSGCPRRPARYSGP